MKSFIQQKKVLHTRKVIFLFLDHGLKTYEIQQITTLRQNGLLPRKNVTEILNIVHETTCPQGLRTGFG